MRLQRFERPIVSIPSNGKQHAIKLFAGYVGIRRTETINARFQLRAHSVVVEWRGEHQHVGFQNTLTNLIEAIMLNARATIPADNATSAGVYVCMGNLDDLHIMPVVPCTTREFFCQNRS